jgi:hypothetical protein
MKMDFPQIIKTVGKVAIYKYNRPEFSGINAE